MPAVELVSVTVDEARRQNVSVYLRGLGSVWALNTVKAPYLKRSISSIRNERNTARGTPSSSFIARDLAQFADALLKRDAMTRDADAGFRAW